MIIEELPQNDKPQTTQTNQPSHEIGHLSIAQRFNVENPTKEDEKKLSEIWDYVKQNSGKSEITDLVWEVMHLENQIGTPRIGEARLDRVYRYCKLRRQANIIDSELKSISGL
jgi:hypothetical protein